MTELDRQAKSIRSARRTPTFARLSLYTFAGLVVVAWVYIFAEGDSGFIDLFRSRTWDNAVSFLSHMAGMGLEETPAFLRPEQWWATGKLAYDTLAMSVLAIGIAGFGAFLTFMFAARNLSNGDMGGKPSRLGAALYYVLRMFYAFTRAVPELVWALLIVFFLSPGILPGAIALGIHNLGIVGRLAAEVVEDMDPAPARALRALGRGDVPGVPLRGAAPDPASLHHLSALPLGGGDPDHRGGGVCQCRGTGTGVSPQPQLLSL